MQQSNPAKIPTLRVVVFLVDILLRGLELFNASGVARVSVFSGTLHLRKDAETRRGIKLHLHGQCRDGNRGSEELHFCLLLRDSSGVFVSIRVVICFCFYRGDGTKRN